MAEEVVTGVAANMPARIPRRIETERLLLRCPREADGPALHAAIVASAERLAPWFGWIGGTKITLKSSATSARFARWRFLAGRELQFHIFEKDKGPLVGVAGLCHPDWAARHFELSYWLRTGYEGRGFAAEAVSALTTFAFEQLAAQRLEIRCDPENGSSLALARRLRFEAERTIPHGRRDSRSGEWRDVVVFVRRPSSPPES